jgi:murein DD-endopeptidase MepM/ murein hydrolase activator NlpD
LRPGDELLILPVTGVRYTIKKGDTVESIAGKYDADAGEILLFNELAAGEVLREGDYIIIPNVEVKVPKPTAPSIKGGSGPSVPGYYMRPIVGGRKSQGIHGYNGVDLAGSCGMPIAASASGTVVIAKKSGWNGGYGKYIAIEHPNGTQTVYGHLSLVDVSTGWWVVKGQEIGAIGSTGRSTGCHLHFEVRGARNPF